ncbi:MAG: hypothetical protein HY308_17470 [Gammaproteobacteria bacterium]|nr:hypothetical protein [Gammaproteobacteria bacterium]
MTSSTSANERPDFLGRLIERTADVGSAPQPRLPSLFEPVPWTAAKNGIVADDDVASIGDTETEARPRVTASIQRSTNAQLEEPPRQRSANVDAPESTRPTRTMDAPSDRPNPVTSTTSTIETLHRIVLDPIAPVSMPSLRGTRADATFVLPVEPSRVKATSPASFDPSSLDHERRRTGTASSTKAIEPAPLPRLPHERVVAEPSAIFDQARAWRESVASTAPESTPVINVTIGRLEIRATKDSVAPKRAGTERAAGAQPMSLAEYLQQRGRGR